MKIVLKKKPKNATIIEGFPGFGLIGTIATEFLIEHLKPELIGEFIYDELPPTVAIHKGELVRPMAVFYDKKHNLVILHTILNTKGNEWSVANEIVNMAKELEAKEIISIEGVATAQQKPKDITVYYYGEPKFKDLGLKPVDESIIMGVTSAVMLKFDKMKCLFAETNLGLPDSKAAAKIVEILNSYLGLKINTDPLLKQAAEFEGKIKTILKQSTDTVDTANKKNLSYLG